MNEIMHRIYCQRCKFELAIMYISQDKKDSILELNRKRSLVGVLREVRAASGVDIKDAKGIMQHLPREKGFCHHCNTPLEKTNEDYSICLSCKSVNFDW